MIGTEIKFKNRPLETGGFETFTIKDCLVANNGSPNASRPQILIHLPKTDQRPVDGAFVTYNGQDYHVVDTTAPQMDGNTPTRWDRYAIAERIRAL